VLYHVHDTTRPWRQICQLGHTASSNRRPFDSMTALCMRFNSVLSNFCRATSQSDYKVNGSSGRSLRVRSVALSTANGANSKSHASTNATYAAP
jgi:hypothetical protein